MTIKDAWELLGNDPRNEKARKWVFKYPTTHTETTNWISVNLRNSKEKISLSEEQFKDMMEQSGNIYLINDNNNKWTGNTINKIEIKTTEPDKDRTKKDFEEMINALIIRVKTKAKQVWDDAKPEEREYYETIEEKNKKRVAQLCYDFRAKKGWIKGEEKRS